MVGNYHESVYIRLEKSSSNVHLLGGVRMNENKKLGLKFIRLVAARGVTFWLQL